MDSVRASIGPALAERYSIERELGSGAMARVFLAHDLKHDRPVAIKVLKPDVANAIGAERFHREIDVVGGLTHPHILPLYDSGEAAGLLYFVMPRIEGESLRSRLDRDRCLSVGEATRIAREMADALEFAHRHGVVHRDVKPANIMLPDGHAQLADFGIAHLVEGADTTLTDTGITVGTPAYMSPEQVAGERSLDGRSDIYSLGCVLFEMLAGHPPFQDASRRAVLLHQIVDSAPDIRIDCREAPPELAGIVRTALQKKPSDRFASAREMSEALAAVRSSIDITAGARMRRALKRRGLRLRTWQRAGLVGLLVVLALVGPGVIREIIRPAPQAMGAVNDPRGSYAVIPFARRGQTALEDSIAARAADRLAFNLDGWNRVEATREYELTGPMRDLGVEGLVFRSLDEGLSVSRLVRRGTMIGVTAQVVGDTVFLEALQYDTQTGDRLGTLQATHASLGDLQALVAPIADRILQTRGEDPGRLLRESNNQDAWQAFWAAQDALVAWRLQEAEEGFRRAIQLDPDFARAHHYLAVTLFWQTSRDVELRRTLIPQIQSITAEAVRLASAGDLNPRLKAHVESLHSFANGDYEAARDGYGALIAADSTDTDAWLFLGVVESADPWQAAGSNPPVPRGDLNLARRAFDFTSRRWAGSPISRGLHFEISEKLGDYLISPACPMYIASTGDEMVVPYTDPRDADYFAVFPLIQGDTIAWVDCDGVFEDLSRAEAREAFRGAAEQLYEESIAEIERWTRYAPDQARPHEEWADMILWWHSRQACDTDAAVASDLIRDALGHMEAALALSPDTTAQQQITHALLLLAAGESDGPRTARLVDRVIADLGRSGYSQYPTPSWTAANAFLAAGQPTKAIERMRGLWVDEMRSVRDPEDVQEYDYGDVFQSFGDIRVLGAVGATGSSITEAVAAVNSVWMDPDRSDRARAVLRRSSTRERSRSADIRPALALDSDMRAIWLSNWGDLSESLMPVWKGLLAVDQDPDSADAWFREASSRLDTMNRPFATEFFLTGLLAQRIGEDEIAAELFARTQECPLNVKTLDVGWGLTRLARLYRARSLERLGRLAEAEREYRAVVREWASADSEVLPRVEEARQGIERLVQESRAISSAGREP